MMQDSSQRTFLCARWLLPVLLSLVVLVVGIASFAGAQTIRYVDIDATGANDGSSWDDAYTDLQEALTAAGGGGYEIWVAEGTYKPTDGTDRTATFQLESGVALYGGFLGDEEVRTDRDWSTYETILSGNIGGAGDTDNCHHVVTGSGTDGSAVLDGFTVTGGLARGFGDVMYGSGMHNHNGSPTVANCTFSGNCAVYGGGMCNRNGSDPTVTDCTFFDNEADDQNGGGMCNLNGSSPTVENCTFTGNFAEWYGGGMCNFSGSNPRVTGCVFDGNRADEGGGIYNSGSSPMVTDCSFSGHDEVLCGGGMCNCNGSDPTVTGCVFSANLAGWLSSDGSFVYGEGGGMCNRNGCDPTVTGCTFEENIAYVGGGGMHNGGNSSPTVTDCAFSGNRAGWSKSDGSIGGGEGGGVYNGGGSPTLTGCTFEENTAYVDGGGMYNTGGSPTLTDCIFSSNSGEFGKGGGVYSDTSDLSATGCTFSENWADQAGGGMYSTGSSLTVTDCGFTGNWVGATGGGGMCNVYCTGNVTACTFSSNEATQGGGMYNEESSPAVAGCTFHGNTAARGGGVGNRRSSPTVSGCSFDGNRATYSGGGMDIFLGDPEVVDCSFDGNVSLDGGGIYIYAWGERPTVAGCTFHGNLATYGGAMYNTDSDPTVTNCTFSENIGTANGGGMHNYRAAPTLIHCTFFGNSAPVGSDIYSREDSPTVRSTILAGDCGGNTPISSGHNLESGTSCGCSQSTDQQNADPLLGPLDDNGGPTLTHALLNGSPALDAIPPPHNDEPPTDQRGVVRPQPTGGACDIGAVEMRWFTLTVAKEGTGAGTVTGSFAGIDCGGSCTASYVNGTHVTLTATPGAHSAFAGWSDAATGCGLAVALTMNEDKDVTATFSLLAFAPGDVNGDSAIDLLDVVLCTQIARGWVSGTAQQRAAADVDGDGDVDAEDVRILSEYVLGIRTTLQ